MRKHHRFLSHFFKFLDSNPFPGVVYLRVSQCLGYTNVQYDTDSKYYQNEEFFALMPGVRYYGIAEQELWGFLAAQGHAGQACFYDMSDALTDDVYLSPRERNAWIIKNQVRTGSPAKARSVIIEVEEEQALHEYLKVYTSTKGPAQQPVSIELCHLRDLHKMATQLTNSWNDRIESELEHQINWQLQFRDCKPQSRAELLNAIGSYTCHDGIELSRVTEEHFRPFRLAGLQVTLADAGEPLEIQLVFTDTRCLGNVCDLARCQMQTEEFCLTFGYDKLYLGPAYQIWLEEFGICTSEYPGQLVVQAAKMLAAPRFSLL